MSDWKPGDRFTIEFEVARVHPDRWIYTSSEWSISPETMETAVKLPPKARPVRKGDGIVRNRGIGPCTFIATSGGNLVYWEPRGEATCHESLGCRDLWTHTDGAPISWEDSE